MAQALAVVPLLFAFVLAGQDPGSEPPAIRGTVLDANTGQPVKKATVIVRQELGDRGGFATVTGSDGRFEFVGLKEGAWVAEVQRDGYVAIDGGDNRYKDLRWRVPSADAHNVRLTPAGVIAGRVLDQDGEPVAGASVSATPAGAKTAMPRLTYAQTNDLGEYRLYNLAPGKYIVSASYELRWKGTATRTLPKGGRQQPADDYVTTWYPAGIDAAEAGPVGVGVGRQVAGIDIKLLRAAVVRVRGRVVALDGTLGPIGFLTLMEAARRTQGRTLTSVMRPDGTFEFDSVRPGRYVLQCQAGLQEKQQLAGRVPVEVADTDIEGIQVPVGPPRAIRGVLAAQGTAPLPNGLHALLVPREEDPTHQSGGFTQVRTDGSFVFERVYDGIYDLLLTKLTGDPDDFYVAAMRIADEDALDKGLSVSGSEVPKLEVTLRDDGATLECAVLSDGAKPAAGAQVIAVPEEHPHALVLYGQTQADEKGVAKLQGLAPGSYRVYAFEGRREINFSRPETLKPFRESGKAVRLAAHERARLELPAIPAEPERE